MRQVGCACVLHLQADDGPARAKISADAARGRSWGSRRAPSPRYLRDPTWAPKKVPLNLGTQGTLECFPTFRSRESDTTERLD